MTREEKRALVAELQESVNTRPHFYIADITGLNAEQTSRLRRKCFEESIELRVVKNTLFRKALEQSDREDFSELFPVLVGGSCIFFSEVGNAPARLIKDFRGPKGQIPVLKAAYVEESFYLGNDQLETLATLKSREELIADIVMLLQSPARTLVGAVKSSGGKIAGIVKTLADRAE